MSGTEYSTNNNEETSVVNNLASHLSNLDMTNDVVVNEQQSQQPELRGNSNPILTSDIYFNDHSEGINPLYNPAQSLNSLTLSGPPPPGFGNDDDDESYETSLFLGDLSVYSTEKDIRKLFSPFGIIERIRIKRGSSGKPHLSYGFITFRDRESAERALQEINGVMFLGRSLRLGWAEPKTQIKIPKVRNEVLQTAQIHVSYISKQIDMLITEETLRSIFGKFGQVVDVAIKKSQFDKRLRLQNGYGFIHFPLTQQGLQAAVDATYNVHQVTIDRVTYDCSLSRYLDEFQLPQPQIYAEFARREVKAVNGSHGYHQQQQPRFFPPSGRPSPYQAISSHASYVAHEINPPRSAASHYPPQGFSSYGQIPPTLSAVPRLPSSEIPRGIQQSVPPNSMYTTYGNRIDSDSRAMESTYLPRAAGYDHRSYSGHPTVPSPTANSIPYSTDSPNLLPSTYRAPLDPFGNSITSPAGGITYNQFPRGNVNTNNVSRDISSLGESFNSSISSRPFGSERF